MSSNKIFLSILSSTPLLIKSKKTTKQKKNKLKKLKKQDLFIENEAKGHIWHWPDILPLVDLDNNFPNVQHRCQSTPRTVRPFMLRRIYSWHLCQLLEHLLILWGPSPAEGPLSKAVRYVCVYFSNTCHRQLKWRWFYLIWKRKNLLCHLCAPTMCTQELVDKYIK